MKLLWVNRVLLTLLSVMTGAVKLASMDEEMKLFRAVGFPDPAIWGFGAVQLLAGILLVPPKTTHRAAWIMALTFCAATAVLFIKGMVAFGVFSLLFIAMAVAHARLWPATRASEH